MTRSRRFRTLTSSPPPGRRALRIVAVLIGAALLLAPTASADTRVADDQPAAAPQPPATAKARCERPTEQQADSSGKYELSVQGRERTYILRLPARYETRDDWPLIVAFHGRGGTGTELEGYSGLSTLPAVVAYPSGELGTGEDYRRAWQGAPYQPPGVDDVAFTASLLDELQSSWCVDPDRTYATGKSNGGGLAGLLACRLPDRFAAVAVVAGAHYPQARAGCDDAGPMPMMAIHGTGDTTVPYAGDPDRDLPSIPDWVNGWVARDGCGGEPTERTRGDDVTITRWSRCEDRTEVVRVDIADGGHVWPGALAYSGGGRLSRTAPAQDLIWQFFGRHTAPATTNGGTR